MTHPETTPGPQPTDDHTPTAGPAPVVVYQNPDFVSGLLQAILGAGLLESAETEDQQNYSQSQNQGDTAGAKAAGKVGFLGFGSADANADLQRVREAIQADQTNRAQRLKYVFSQAYYLNYLRHLLTERNIIRSVTDLESAHNLTPGDIIEFSSTFRANEINAVLDIATPELVSTVTKFAMLRANDRALRNIDDVQAIAKTRSVAELKAADSAELAAAVATALRQDFRSEHTREFYGLIASSTDPGVREDDDTDVEDDALTAVTVCETAHFATADPDRLLDGHFTVLGKVVSPLQQDVGVLERNKLLDRVHPDFLATVFDNLANLARIPDDSDDSEQAPGPNLTEGFEGSAIDLEFSAYVPGSSFAVLPIAIYA